VTDNGKEQEVCMTKINKNHTKIEEYFRSLFQKCVYVLQGFLYAIRNSTNRTVFQENGRRPCVCKRYLKRISATPTIIVVFLRPS
jgi:hypothetical protein